MSDETEPGDGAFAREDWRKAIVNLLAHGVSASTIRACLDAPAELFDEVLRDR